MRPFLSAVLLALITTTASAAGGEKTAAPMAAAVLKTGEAFFAAWNQHDVKAMVGYWADDATLVNPRGRVAHGKTEIDKLLSDEQTTVFKTSTAKLAELKITRELGPGMVFCDGEMTVDGGVDPAGTALPQMRLHLAVIMAKKGSAWVFQDARPYEFIRPPAKMN
jgi:uncharacterized protein (TIGR02246 family)